MRVWLQIQGSRVRSRSGPVPYFRGDWSWNNFYGHSPPFRWFIQEGLLSVTSESMCTNYWLAACSSLPRKSVVRLTDRPAMTIAVDLGRKAKIQTNKTNYPSVNSIGSIQTQQKLELKRPKSVLNYKTKRNTKQTPWNMIKHDQTDKIRDCAWFTVFVLLVWFDLILYVPVNNLSVT